MLAAKEAENLLLREASTKPYQDFDAKNRLIPRPPGERGKDGWNLQKHMGLENDDKTYSNIRVSSLALHSILQFSFYSLPVKRCVRYAVYESQLDISKRINEQNEKSLFTCYAVVGTVQFLALLLT